FRLWYRRTWSLPSSASALSRRPTPGAWTSMPMWSRAGSRAAEWRSASPLPKPISRMRGALRPNTASKSRGSPLSSRPNRGHSASKARRWAGVKRPCRSTKLRTRRRPSSTVKGLGGALAPGLEKGSVIGRASADQAVDRRGGAGVALARDAPGAERGAPGLHRQLHGVRHERGFAGPGDRGVHEHAVAAELHRDGRVGGRAHAGVDDDRHLGVVDDLEQVPAVLDAQ